MDKIVQLAEYRERRQHNAGRLTGQKLWVCGRCGSHTWTVSVDAQVRCTECEARAWNLEVVQAPSGGMPQ